MENRWRARAAFLVVATVMVVVAGAGSTHATMMTYDTGLHLIVVPPGVTQMTFDLYGAQGSGGNAVSSGGLGGRTAATLDVTPGVTLQLNVGGAGNNGVHPGYNGGGNHGPSTGGGVGGGATDLRLNDGTTKLLVAGGGGGGGADSLGVIGGNGGPGGGMTSPDGAGSDGTAHGLALGGGGGGGGSDAAGGMGGAGGAGAFSGSPGSDGALGQGGQGGDGFAFGGGGGGGGLYGGGGGGGGGGTTGNAPGGGGGGGSSFGPVGTTFEIGVQSGDGSAVVTYTSGSTTTTTTGATTTTTGATTTTTGATTTTTGATTTTTSTTVPSSGLTFSFAVHVDDCVAGATPQLCTPIPTVPLPTDGVLKVEFESANGQCSNVIAHLLVDGVERFVSGALPPGEGTGMQDLGPVAVGGHAVGVQAEGVVGGCNAGSLASWGGTLMLTVTGITATDGAIAAPGEAVHVSTVVNASPAPAAIDASYTRPADATGLATLVAATYYPPDPITPPDPIIPPNPIIGSVGFVDLRLVGGGAGDVVQARFAPPDPILPTDLQQLFFFDGTTWSPVLGSDAAPPAYVGGSGFTISFTDTSTPKVTALGGTVFAFVATPLSGCAATPVGATFASLACRFADLTTETQSESALGALGPKLLAALGKATTHGKSAQDQCASGKTKPAKAQLKQVVKQLAQYGHRLKSHAARKIPESVRTPLAQTADGIGTDAKTLRGALHCPADAAPAGG